MPEPTVAPTAEINLGGEVRTLKYGFRAYKELGVNPFELASIEEFQTRPPSIDTVAQSVRAGLLHEYAKNGPRHGQAPPTVEDIVDLLDMPSFVGIWRDMIRAMGGDAPDEKSTEETESEGSKNPLVTVA